MTSFAALPGRHRRCSPRQASGARPGAVTALAAGPGLGAVRPDVVPLTRAAVPGSDQAESLGRGAHRWPLPSRH